MKKLLLAYALLGGLRLEAGTTYPMEGGSLRRENRALSVPGATAPVALAWSVTTCGRNAVSNPVVMETSLVQAYQNSLVCLSRSDGQILWSWSSNGVSDLFNPPSYDSARGLLYQSGLNGALVALRASDGQPQWWRYEGAAPNVNNWGSATYDNGRIYFGNAAGALVCLNADTQAEIWRYNFPQAQGCGTPAIDGGNIYVAGDKGTVACVNAVTGALVWQISAGGLCRYMSSVLLTNTHLYIMQARGRVDCRLRSNGSLAWSYLTDSWSLANLALGDNALYCASDDRCLHKLDLLTGTLLWKHCFTGNFARSGPFYCGGLVFGSGCTGDYYGTDACGIPVWSFNHGIDNSFVDWAEADGQVFASNRMGVMHCFAPTTGVPTPVCPVSTPTLTSTPSPILTQTPSFTVSPSGTATRTSTPTATPSRTPSFSPTRTPTASPSRTLTSSQTATASPTSTPSASFTVAGTSTFTPSVTPSQTTSATATPAAGELPGGDDPGDIGDDGIVVYPNPVRDGRCRVALKMKEPGSCKIRFFTVAGEEAGTFKCRHNNSGTRSVECDIREFSAGVYFLKADKDYDSGRHEKTKLNKCIVIKN